MHISQTYAENLLPLREGYPLWIPEPDEELPMCYRETGARIGDVGVISQDGGFRFLFNICSGADDPVNKGGVPAGFECIDTGPTRYTSAYYSRAGAFVQSADFARKAIGVEAGVDAAIVPAGAEFGVEFSVEKEEGAILALPQGGSRRDAQNLREYEAQIQRHAKEWYEYVREIRGWKIDNGDLYLVTGIDKALAWGALAFRDTHRSHEVSFQFTATPAASAGLRHQYQWRHLTSQSARQGPDAGVLMYDDNGTPAENQCVFVRGYKIMIRRELWPRRRTTSTKVVDFTGARNFGKSTSIKATSSSTASTSSAAKGKGRQVHFTDVFTDSAERSPGTIDDEGDGSSSSECSSSGEENWSTEDGVSWKYVPRLTTPYHPCDALNEYILDNSDCSIAFTHDNLWICTTGDADVVCDLEYDFEIIGIDAATLRHRENVSGRDLEQNCAEDATMTGAVMTDDQSEAYSTLNKNSQKSDIIEDSPVFKQEGSSEGPLIEQEEVPSKDMYWVPFTRSCGLEQIEAIPRSRVLPAPQAPSEALGSSPGGTYPIFTFGSIDRPMSSFLLSSPGVSPNSLEGGEDCAKEGTSESGYSGQVLEEERPYRNHVGTPSRRKADVARRAARAIFTCPVAGCQITFTRRQSLKNHILAHENKKLFSCPVLGCGCRFNTRSLLRWHHKRKHNSPLPSSSAMES